MGGELVSFPGGQEGAVSIPLRLPVRRLSASEAIAATGLSDEQVAELLQSELKVPARPSLIRMWREGAGPEPNDEVVEILAGLSPPLPPAAARRAS